MQFYQDTYYHLYNRTNNAELLFKEPDNYLYFLKQYRKQLIEQVETIAYCLMPTHFHFLIRTKHDRNENISKTIGIWLSSYTKAINKRFNRNGSLFQKHTKAIPIQDNNYLLTLITYIHQNPIRSNIVHNLEAWEYSSYPDYINQRNGTLPNKKIIYGWFKDHEGYKKFSEQLIENVDKKYWII